jgi:hypothetical protein
MRADISVPWEPMVYQEEVLKLGDDNFETSMGIFEED